jgi:hypothetical protein
MRRRPTWFHTRMRTRAFLFLVLSATLSFAQQQQGGARANGQGTQGTQAGQTEAPEAARPEAKDAPTKPAGNTAGYSYSDTPRAKSSGKPAAPSRSAGHAAKHASLAIASYPAFTQNEGRSRLTVRLSKKLEVEEKKGQGNVTYVIKGAHIQHWNDTHPLVMVHFNTPAASARMHPSKNDVVFSIDLRSAVSPTFSVVEDGQGSMLQVDFPAGEYLPKSPESAPGT